MKKFFIIGFSLLLICQAHGQSRRMGVTRSEASKKASQVTYTQEPNYEPVITNLGKILSVENGIAYVKVNAKYDTSAEGYYYFYSCNIQAQATAILEFDKEFFRDVYAMKIKEGTCEQDDYVYLRFVPKAPLDVLLPF